MNNKIKILTINEIETALAEVREELLRALNKHPGGFTSGHDGWAKLFEEVDELWDHVKADTGRTREARKEACQVAAMGLRYMLDLCTPPVQTDGELYPVGHSKNP